MSTIARVTAPILLILAAYTGGGAELIFPHSIAGTSDTVWIIAILAAGLLNLASILWLQRDTSAHSLALQGLLLKALHPPPQHRLPPLHRVPCCRTHGSPISPASHRLPVHTHMRHVRTPADEFPVRHSGGASCPH